MDMEQGKVLGMEEGMVCRPALDSMVLEDMALDSMGLCRSSRKRVKTLPKLKPKVMLVFS
jgi:hypothetical protein